ncbi:MAG: DUF1249 domain-containing protein [Pseudomonadales bacterium]
MNRKRRYVPDLVSDMAECDANYIRLLRLFPNLGQEDQLEFGIEGTTEDGAIVKITIEQRCPYTTMLSVRVSNGEDKPWVKWPVLEIRLYHDVRSAEVVSFQRHRNFKYRYYTPNPNMYQPDEKSQINRFLGELLTFCARYGRSLEAVTLPRRGDSL